MPEVRLPERLHWLMPESHYLTSLKKCKQGICSQEGLLILGAAVQLFAQPLAAEIINEISTHSMVYVVDEDCELFLGDLLLPSEIEVVKTSSIADLVMQYDLHETWS